MERETLRRLDLAQASRAGGLGPDGGGDGTKGHFYSDHILVDLLMDADGGRMQEGLFFWGKGEEFSC